MIDLAACVAVAVLTSALYWRCRNGEFVFDDLMILDGCRWALRKGYSFDWRDWFDPRSRKRPILWLTYWRDIRAHTLNPLGWHYTNMCVHSANAAIVYGLLRYWYAPEWALLGALAVACHPVGAHSAAYLSGRSSAMCGMFYFGALVAFMAGAYLSLGVCAWAAWNCKEEAITLPGAMFVLWWLG